MNQWLSEVLVPMLGTASRVREVLRTLSGALDRSTREALEKAHGPDERLNAIPFSGHLSRGISLLQIYPQFRSRLYPLGQCGPNQSHSGEITSRERPPESDEGYIELDLDEMMKSRKSEKDTEPLGFEAKSWVAADAMRDDVDAPEYKALNELMVSCVARQFGYDIKRDGKAWL